MSPLKFWKLQWKRKDIDPDDLKYTLFTKIVKSDSEEKLGDNN